MRGVIREVFKDHFGPYQQGRKLSWRENCAAGQILGCRTVEQGSHVVRCEAGDFEESRFNSCKHRSCPVCGTCETDRWVSKEEERALPCPYHQIVFTMPDGLHPLWLYNRNGFTNLLFQSAWEAIREFTDDPKWLGALPGMMAFFQSWGEMLNLHVHLHVLITAGGLDVSGQWVKTRQSFFVPSRALSKVFRGIFRSKLLDGLADGTLQLPSGTTAAFWRMKLNKFGRQDWHVQIDPPYEHPRGAIRYLGAYMRRGPIGESRIKQYDREKLTIAYKRPQEHPHPTFELGAHEFLRRFLTHVPPKGQRVVRHYGLFHHRHRAELEQARQALGVQPATASTTTPVAKPPRPHPPAMRCPHCGKPLKVVAIRFRSCTRGPPEREAA